MTDGALEAGDVAGFGRGNKGGVNGRVRNFVCEAVLIFAAVAAG